jgi:serine/threonine protein kinase
MSTPTQLPPLSRRELNKLQLTPIHRARNWSKADVSVLEWPVGSGQQLVIKDFARRPMWFRVLMGRPLLRREWKTLRALHDVQSVPTAHHRIDQDAFVMDYCQGEKIEDVKVANMPDGLVSQIDDLVKTIHARGVTHGDLHSSNILITGTGNFALIDWATACYFGPDPRGWRKVLFHELSALDDRAVAKIKVIFHPASLTENQRHLLLNGGSTVYRLFKSIRHFFDKLRGQDKSRKRARAMRIYQRKLEQHPSQPSDGKSQNQ